MLLNRITEDHFFRIYKSSFEKVEILKQIITAQKFQETFANSVKEVGKLENNPNGYE